MANHKATRKSTRKSIKRRDHNRYYGKTTRNAMRKIMHADAKKEEVTEQLPKVVAMVDKLAKKNIIHKNKANRLKSQLAKRLNVIA